ncbi:MAG: nucleoside monophosphate kinase [Nanoarchaeota archaeon]|nr:nucleoside monophosphate kinase [Nanoarchaeota archaeon]
MKITIAGKAGSGKSVIAEAIAKEFNLKHYSTGDLFRELATEAGMKVEDFSKTRADEVDFKVDEITTKIGKEEDNFIFDSRLAFHFIPDSIKIFLDVSFEEGAKRIFKDQRESEAKANSVEELAERNKVRWATDNKQYIKLYNIDMDDLTQYDILIDTTNFTINESITKIKQTIRTLQEE